MREGMGQQGQRLLTATEKYGELGRDKKQMSFVGETRILWDPGDRLRLLSKLRI